LVSRASLAKVSSAWRDYYRIVILSVAKNLIQ
jgi:hypothetical protein